MTALFRSSIQVHAQDPGFWKHLRGHLFYFLGSRTKRGNIWGATGRACFRLADGITAVMAHHPTVFVIGQRHITVRTFYRFPTGSAGHKGGIAPSVDK